MYERVYMYTTKLFRMPSYILSFYILLNMLLLYTLYTIHNTTIYHTLLHYSIPYIILITIHYATYNLTSLHYTALQATVNCLRAAKSNKAHTLHDLATSMLDRIVQIAGIVFYPIL